MMEQNHEKFIFLFSFTHVAALNKGAAQAPSIEKAVYKQ